MKRPRRFEDPEDVVMSKITRGLSQSQPQPAQGVQERGSVLRAPAQSFPLHTIDESPGNFVTTPSTTGTGVDTGTVDILSHPQPQLSVPSIQLQAPVPDLSHQAPQYSGQCCHHYYNIGKV